MYLALDFKYPFLKKYLAGIFFLFCAGALFPQENVLENENDKKYTPQGSIFSVENNKNKENRNTDNVTYGVKLMPFELLYSNFVIENEVTLGNTNANLTFGIGLNFTKSYINNNLVIFSDASSSIYRSLSKEEALSNGTYEKGGLFLSCGIKFYKSDFGGMYYNPYQRLDNKGTPFQDVYYYIRFSRFSYHYTLPPMINSRILENSRDFKVSHNKIVYGIGGCLTTGNKTKFIHDFYLGIGMNIFSYSNYKEDGNASYYGTGTPPTPKYILNGTKTNVDITFDIGYGFGFGF